MKAYKILFSFCIAAVIGASLRMVVAVDHGVENPTDLITSTLKDLYDLYQEQSQELAALTLSPASTYLNSFNRYMEQTDIVITAFDQIAFDIKQEALNQLRSILYRHLSHYDAAKVEQPLKEALNNLLTTMINAYHQNMIDARNQVLDAPILASGETLYSLRDLTRREIRNTLGEPLYRQLEQDIYSTGDQIKDSMRSFTAYLKDTYSDIAEKVYDRTIKGSREILKKKIAEEDARLQRQLRRDLGLTETDGQYYYIPRLGRAVKSRSEDNY
jgi:gas vesicle protein